MPADCSLWLDVYEDDRTTIAWTVTTDPGGPLIGVPAYLIDPMRYGEQRIDVAKGAATIGTVTVGVIDPATIANDQDSGWMTFRLSKVFGRRCRLRRYINVVTGYVVIADGPGGEPRLEPDYSSYTWEIRDTRETERKIKLFSTGARRAFIPPGINPPGVLGGYGALEAIGPIIGTYVVVSGAAFFRFDDDWSDNPIIVAPDLSDVSWNVVLDTRHQLPEPTIVKTFDHPSDETLDTWLITWPTLRVLMRAEGSMGAFEEIAPSRTFTGSLAQLNAAFGGVSSPEGLRLPGQFFLGSTFPAPVQVVTALYRIRAGDLGKVGGAAPAVNSRWEILLVQEDVAPTRLRPFHLEGLTAGEFVQNVYDGLYSPRDVDGNVVPTGILYDEAAVLAMDTEVRIRLFEPIADARDWLEKYIYAPTGYVPALDDQGRISPVSQVAPADDTGLPVIDNAITEPNATWGGGARVINILRFTYPRDYVPLPEIEVERAGDGMAEGTVPLEFRNAESIAKHGEQVLELDGRAFRAIGTNIGTAPFDNIQNETGHHLAHARNEHVKRRYVNGAPAFPAAVMRSGTPGVRAGSFVAVDLSWLPDPYVTGRRGLTGIAQVMGVAELDCAWREMSLEMVPPAEEEEPEEPPAEDSPEAIADLDASPVSHSRILLTWSLPDGATGVKIHRDTTTGFTPGGGNLVATVGAIESLEDTGLNAATEYFYIAIATNAAGDAPDSNEASAETGAADLQAPTIVAGPYDADNDEITVEITPHPDTPPGVLWHVEHSSDEGETYAAAEDDTAETIVHSHVMSGAQSCWLYVYGTLSGWTDSPPSNVEIIPAEEA